MVWFRVDDQLAFHMKALTAGNAAMGLWVRAGSWSGAQLSDGFVPAPIVAALGGSPTDAAALVAAGLWHEVEGGWQFHDWSDHQPTREKVLADRAAVKDRVAKHRAKRGANDGGNGAGNAVENGDRNGVTEGGNADRNGVTHGVGTTPPSRPVPTRPEDSTKTSTSPSRNDRASVSTDSVEISEITARMANNQGVYDLRAVIALVAERLDRQLDGPLAFQLATDLLDRAKEHPKAPQRYVESCIVKSPAEVQKWIDERAA